MVELLLVTGLVGAVVLVVIGLPCAVRGLTLAVTTLGLAVIACRIGCISKDGWAAALRSTNRCSP